MGRIKEGQVKKKREGFVNVSKLIEHTGQEIKIKSYSPEYNICQKFWTSSALALVMF